MNTEISPPDLPEGISPDCQDVAFLPGSVQQRPALQIAYKSGLTNTLVYQKSFVQPSEQAVNVIIDAANNFSLQTPGSLSVTPPFSTLPEPPGGIQEVISTTQFGREYFAFSDGFHGSHVPLQFDGTFLDRVTQDGPGAGCQTIDEISDYTIAASGVPGLEGANATANILSGSEAGTTASFIVDVLPWDVEVGDVISVAGCPTGYNTGGFVLAISGNTIQLGFLKATGLAPFTGGGGVMTFGGWQVTTTTANAFTVGLLAVISGASPSPYDGTWRVAEIISDETFIVAATISNAGTGGGGNVSIGGNVSEGTHQVVVMFLTRQGYITKPSPAFAWDSGGSVRAVFSNIPIGPANVVARILALTGAGGDNFFYIPTTIQVPSGFGTPSSTVYATVINDNTTSSATIDFADNSLFGATGIDIPGRNYFNQVVLSDCCGVFPYASRMFWWGETNKIQNFLNMGFEGGYLSGFLGTPLGWTVNTSGGALVPGGSWAAGQAWQITANTAGTFGQIQQPAFQDSLGVAILSPSTLYSLRLWCSISGPFATVSIVANLYSPTAGLIATLSIPGASIPPTGGFLSVGFSAATPTVIPADTVFQIGVVSTGNSAGTLVTLDEQQNVPTLNPYRDALFRASYVNAPEQMDGVTGVIGSTNDPSQIRNCSQLRNVMYFNTANGKHSTTDNGYGEPSTWNVPEVSQAIGSVSFHGTDPGRAGTGESGEQWEFIISDGGLYVFQGGELLKVSQEIQSDTQSGEPGWDSINKAAIQTSWVKNDRVNRRCYVGVPVNEATAPNIIFVLDYRELNDAYAISNSPPVHISFTGKMIASDLCRKWTRWNISANCAEMMAVTNSDYEFSLGGGNGQAAAIASGFGNAYILNDEKFTDDDYGQITPYYTTYFFVSRDQEQQLQLDCHRKLASYLSMFITGLGQTSITPLSDTLANAFPACPAYPLSASLNHDYEWGLNVTGERIALKIGSVPAAGQTDNAFNLQHLALTLKKEPIAFLRGAM